MILLAQNEKAYVWIAFINISNRHDPCSYSWCSILFVANIMLFHTQHDNFDIHKLNVEDTDVYISIGTTFLRVFIKNNLYRFSSENLVAWNPRPPLTTCSPRKNLQGTKNSLREPPHHYLLVTWTRWVADLKTAPDVFSISLRAGISIIRLLWKFWSSLFKIWKDLPDPACSWRY